jgi:glutathione S-transferase
MKVKLHTEQLMSSASRRDWAHEEAWTNGILGIADDAKLWQRNCVSSGTANAMTEPRPKLVTFALSHFCEKARWALDWHGIAYDEISWPPGIHVILAKRCGAKGTTLPILLTGSEVIQGSAAIIDWADANGKNTNRNLTPGDQTTEAREIERRADEVIGIHVRRLAYSELLPRYANALKPALLHRSRGWHRVAGNLMWPITWRIMMRAYDTGREAAAESREKLESELDWLDAKLIDGRSFLVGETFSRADLSVASLLANFAAGTAVPRQPKMILPKTLTTDIDRWRTRPVMRWVSGQYETQRTIDRLT